MEKGGTGSDIGAHRWTPCGNEGYNEPRTQFDTHMRLLVEARVSMAGRVLDVGCGEGHFGSLLLDAGFDEVVGVEPHGPSASRANTKLTRVLRGRFPTKEVIPAGPFDLVVFSDSLEHIADPWDALAFARSLTTPGGHILVSVPNVCHYSVLLEQIRGRWDYAEAGLLDKGHVRFFTRLTLLEALRGAGFRTTGLTCRESVPQGQWLRPGTALMRRLTPHLFWYQVLAVARRD